MISEQAPTPLVVNAIRSLLYEVTVTPKPGLVDPASQGPHPDMTAFTFINSALSLQPYFIQCEQAGRHFRAKDLTQLFRQLRPLGVDAEQKMFTTTFNVNTHKGAIFSLGILVAASAYQIEHLERNLSEIVQDMLIGLTAHDFKGLLKKDPAKLTIGEKMYLEYGIEGIRGEAEAGYPTVFHFALPTLCKSVGTLNQRLLDTLMTIVSNSIDTNLVKRANNIEVVDWAHTQAQTYLALGGSQTATGWQKLIEINKIFEERHLSLGGSADLLILTIFLGLQKGMITAP